MCGICGIYRTEPREEAGSRQAVRAMAWLMVQPALHMAIDGAWVCGGEFWCTVQACVCSG
jgi:hypothetical protein